jgi:hypothetical protein
MGEGWGVGKTFATNSPNLLEFFVFVRAIRGER